MCSLHEDDVLHSEQSISYNDLSRRQIRALIFHLLYAAEAHDYQTSLDSITLNLSRGYAVEIPLDSLAFLSAEAVIENRHDLDQKIMPFLHNWRFERIGCCTMLILRYAMWELFYTDTAPNIVINEAVELAKCFSEKDAYKFVNGILDEAVKAKEEQPKES